MNKKSLALNLQIKIPCIKPCQKQEHSCPNNRNSISKITPSLYLSGYTIASDHSFGKLNHFTHIINCADNSSRLLNSEEKAKKSFCVSNLENIKNGTGYLHDNLSTDIISSIYQAIHFIESDNNNKASNTGNNIKIIFHCIEGISRGPAILAGYLMWKNNLKVQEAITLIKERRPCVDINLGFMIQGTKWENYLNGQSDKLIVFRGDSLNETVLLDENDLEHGHLDKLALKEEFLIRWKRRLFILNCSDCTNDAKEPRSKGFILNVQKYDKTGIDNCNIVNIVCRDIQTPKRIIEKVEEVISVCGS